MTSPTARTLGYLRRRGCLVAVVERWVKTATLGFRRDLFGFADLLAIEPHQRGVLFVQVCMDQHRAQHLEKIRSAKVWPNVTMALRAGNRVCVMSWALKGQRGKRKVFQVTRVEVAVP